VRCPGEASWLIVAFLTVSGEMAARGWERVRKEVVEGTDLFEAKMLPGCWEAVAAEEYLAVLA